MEIKENINLANHTTFRIGGPAKFFVEVNSREELIEALKWAKEKSLPYFILGGGSNLLVSDKGFDGLVIKMQNVNIKMQNGPRYAEGFGEASNAGCKIIADAGASLIKIILETTKMGFSGAEWGFGIPGTIGGAICGNAHRLGQSFSQVVDSVEILDTEFNSKILCREKCNFAYGESRFKKTGEIILSASLLFGKKDQANIDDVLEQAKCIVRAQAPFPSAGCVFKNYETKGVGDSLLQGHPELKERLREGKLGVGYLIDQCGLKGKQIGGAKIWEGHANFIINVGGAKATDVLSLIGICKKSVAEKYNIEMDEEIRCIGF